MKHNVAKILYTASIPFRVLGQVSCFIYPPIVCSIFNYFVDSFYSGRISKKFKKCGDKLYVKRKITLYKPHNISIGSNVEIHKNAIIATHSNNALIDIGNDVVVGEYCHITSLNKITIKDGVLLGKKCLITDNNHGDVDLGSLIIPPSKRTIVSKGEVVIGKNVWLGDNVVVLPGVEIGESCIIGASSVVTKSMPPFSICVGNPAKVIKTI